MLKKLLASALAVATVASCAYVPTALASAATTYKTANAIEYEAYKLLNPDDPSSNIDVTIYVSSNLSDITGVYTKNIAPEDNNATYLEENLAGAKDKDGEALSLDDDEDSSEVSTRRVVKYLVASDQANVYVAYIAVQAAVEYSAIDDGATYLPSTDADTLAASHLAILDWYDYDGTTVDTQTVLKDMYAGSYASEAKVAGKVFNVWTVDVSNSCLVLPDFKDVDKEFEEKYTDLYYTKVDVVYVPTNLTKDERLTSTQLTTGSYYTTTSWSAADNLYLPNNDSANWTTYLWNYLVVKGAKHGLNGLVITDDYFVVTATNGATYEPYSVKAVPQGDNANKQYAVIYKAQGSTSDTVDYTLKLYLDDDLVEVKTLTKDDASTSYVTDPEQVYALVKPSGAPATLAEYLETIDKEGDNGKYSVIYESTGVITELFTNTADQNVTVGLKVAPKYLTTVYSYGNGTVECSETYLSKAQLANTVYGIQGVNGYIQETVNAATADDLDVATDAIIEGVPAQYAYNKAYNADGKQVVTAPSASSNWSNPANYTAGEALFTVETTYVLGEATAAITDFQTATGEFKVEPYFCRDYAKVGEKVMLKVALTDSGVAKGLDITKVTVKYDVVNCTVSEEVGENNYLFKPEYEGDIRPEGIATKIILGEGTNIAVANVYYDDALVGTFAPFYTDKVVAK